jgi:hypothetical protein
MRKATVITIGLSVLLASCASSSGVQQSNVASSDIFYWKVARNTSGYDNARQLPVGTELAPFTESAFGLEFKQHEVTDPNKVTDYDHAYGALMFMPLYLSKIVQPAQCTVSDENGAGTGFNEEELLRLIATNVSGVPTQHRAYWAIIRLAPHAHANDPDPKAHSHLVITLPVDCGDANQRQEMVTIITSVDVLPMLESGRPVDATLESLTHNGLIHGPKP